MNVLEGSVRRLENARAVDRPAGAVVDVINRWLPAGRVKDVLSGTDLGHPLHPLLVTVPIGAWVSAGFLDVLGGRSARPAATTLVGLGALAAVPATLTGASDWADTLGAERRIGAVHAASNYAAIASYLASWAARRRGRHRLGLGFSAAGAGLLGVSGWLGGHLTYAAGVGVDTTAFSTLPSEWTDAAPETALAGRDMVAVLVGTVSVLLVNGADAVVALSNRCTHRGAPLGDGALREGCIECPWHNSRFGVADGRVVRGPATRPQQVYEVRVRDGRIQVRQPDEQRTLRTNPVASGNG
ncbi:Rieske 2Fe-2S domain-containing protein [Rhodococcus opacus]|uniref:Putative iron-sulfur protein n=1 Tax=Rhodococcus opacus (strain B4) TaxID=632772 RepID=C1AVC0_RHOOB|nr:Rieske 2Fe-2S domain-containing protein [Rhodococcus opacus]BAH53610.1 putative iron-sulfur protein [Rhodococcus opacus B4]